MNLNQSWLEVGKRYEIAPVRYPDHYLVVDVISDWAPGDFYCVEVIAAWNTWGWWNRNPVDSTLVKRGRAFSLAEGSAEPFGLEGWLVRELSPRDETLYVSAPWKSFKLFKGAM